MGSKLMWDNKTWKKKKKKIFLQYHVCKVLHVEITTQGTKRQAQKCFEQNLLTRGYITYP
jgi:hypothetical protein